MSSPFMSILWPCWVSADPKIKYQTLFPHEETTEFVDFLVGYLDRAASKLLRLAASEKCRLQIEFRFFQCIHLFSITVSPLFSVS